MAAEKGRTTTIDDLTDDLKVEIIRRMPGSSILQFLNVSKLWRSLISNGPLSLTNTINVAASYNEQGRLRCMCLEKGMQQIIELDVLNINKIPYDNWIFSSCNGLLFSYFSSKWRDVSSHECYMSNPWTKECVRLPNPTMTSHKFTMCGLAFENNSNEDNNNVASYKIVMAHRINPYTMEGRHNFTYKFEMYSSVKKRWQLLKSVSEPHPCRDGPWSYYDVLGQSGVHCNRVLYWHCPQEDHALMFNLETETSGYMELPSIGDNVSNPCGRNLTVCDGLLQYSRIGFPNHQYKLTVWRMSMETSGWLMLHNVSLDLKFFPLCRSDYIWSHKLKPIGISCEGGDKVLLAEYSREIDKFFRIISYDFKRDVLEVVLQRDFLRDLKFCRYTPTNKSITKRIKAQKPLSNFGWNLGCFKSAS